jgi:hypothetical protein
MCLRISNGWATLEVLMAVGIRSALFWEVLQYTLTPKYQLFCRITT